MRLVHRVLQNLKDQYCLIKEILNTLRDPSSSRYLSLLMKYIHLSNAVAVELRDRLRRAVHHLEQIQPLVILATAIEC